MLVAEQLRVRMEQLKVPVSELAKRVGVSNQTVRFWLDGRNFPGKRHAPALEKALSFKLDYSEAASPKSQTTADMMDKTDVELLLEIKRLPAEVRLQLERTVGAINQHIAGMREQIRTEERKKMLDALSGRAPNQAEPHATTPPAPSPPVLRRRRSG